MPRVLLLLPTTTYRTKAFIDAALELGIDVTTASEETSSLAKNNPDTLWTLNFFDPILAKQHALVLAEKYPVDAIIPVDEDTAVVAAVVAEALGLNYNPVLAAKIAKNKFLMRTQLKEAGIKVPKFWHFNLDKDWQYIADKLDYPCVVKPVFLSTSRGVMRVDNKDEFFTAVNRLSTLLARPEVARKGGVTAHEILVEKFIPGVEVALEGVLLENTLKVLAIFDKPDPLDGPFFEETIYLTPSRLSQEIQEEIIKTTQAAIDAIGLFNCPIHAELRINKEGVWIIEVAARSIGGLCSRTLRFTKESQDLSLEELLIRHAIGQDISLYKREHLAAGVMMIPTPKPGVLKAVEGLEEAKKVNNIEDIIISAYISQQVAPPPEGASYLGFIFSRAQTPTEVELALRDAHKALDFVIE